MKFEDYPNIMEYGGRTYLPIDAEMGIAKDIIVTYKGKKIDTVALLYLHEDELKKIFKDVI